MIQLKFKLPSTPAQLAAGHTTLAKTNGAKTYPAAAVGPSPSPVIVVGPGHTGDNVGVVGSTNLTADAVKGTNRVIVASIASFAAAL
jgi:hypothetical protein